MFKVKDKGIKKVKFIPISEVNSNGIDENNENYTTITELKQLEWFVHPESKSHISKIQGNSLISSIKPHMDTRVETQTLYFTDLKSGKSGFIQIVYSSVINGIYKGFQLNFKLLHAVDDVKEKDVWESFKLDNIKEFTALKVEFDNLKFEFNKVNKEATPGNEIVSQLDIKFNYNRKAHPNNQNIDTLNINIIADLYPGYIINPNGCSYYLDKPISSINREDKELQSEDISSKMLRHSFIPKGECSGSIYYKNLTGSNEISLKLEKVPVSYIDATQGLLPNRAAKSWNFLCYHSENYSILCMEYTTIPDFGNNTITIWSVVHNNKIVSIKSSVNKNKVKYGNTLVDKENGWAYPTEITFPMKFEEKNLKVVNRYDIMNELPSVVKKIAQNIAHVKPYIYQFCQRSEFENEIGISIVESTFIS